MSLKSVEMQVALPRVLDAARLQEQELQRGTHAAENMPSSVTKEEEKARNQVNELDKKDDAEIKDQNSKHKREDNQQNNKDQLNEDEQPVLMAHPYKGKRIDCLS